AARLRLPGDAGAVPDSVGDRPAVPRPRPGVPVVTVRPIRPDDVPAVISLVRELAEYEKAPDEAKMTEEQLSGALFGDFPALFGHVAEDAGQVVGMALWFRNFSTWRGTHGIYLEDLYVQPAHRGTGLGKELLRTLAEVCVERG